MARRKDPNRDPSGRWLKGHNQPGPGNPNWKRLGDYRQAIARAITTDDLVEVLQMLLSKAKRGDIKAAREVLDRTLGKATQIISATLEDDELVVRLRRAVSEGRHSILQDD